MTEILFLSRSQPRNTGDYLHRTLWPAEAMAKLVETRTIQVTNPLYIKEAIDARLLVVNMVVDESIEKIIHLRRAMNKCTIYEISDDFKSFPASLPLHGFYSQKHNQELIEQLATNSTATQFSSPHLERKYSTLNSQHCHFHNQVNTLPREQKHHIDGTITIGWSGSVGHIAEARLLAEWLAEWSAHSKATNIRFSFMASQSITDIFREKLEEIHTEETGSFDKYVSYLNTLDVGIAILGDDDFSLGRSDGKFLEYATNGALAVCSNKGTYAETVSHLKTGLLFNSKEEFFQAMDVAIDRGSNTRIRGNAYNYIKTERLHRINAQRRLNYYSKTCKHDFDCSVQATASGSNIELIHDVEELIYNSLMLHSSGQLQNAIAGYMEAIEMENAFFLPWLRLSQALTQSGNFAEAEYAKKVASELLENDLMSVPTKS